jgi:hypothetical protein
MTEFAASKKGAQHAATPGNTPASSNGHAPLSRAEFEGIADRLGLTIPDGDHRRGPNPFTGKGNDGFCIFYPECNGSDRKGDFRKSRREMLERAGVPDIVTNHAPSAPTGKQFDMRSLEERGLNAEARAHFQISGALGTSDAWGEYRQFPTFHPDGTPARSRRKFRDPARQTNRQRPAKTIWDTATKDKGQPPAYGLNWIEAGETVYLVNSELAVWLFWQKGRRAICPLGEARSPASFQAMLETAKAKGAAQIVVMLDNDNAGQSATAKATAAARAVGLPTTAKQWPANINDASDFWEMCHAQGHDFISALESLPNAAPDWAAEAPSATPTAEMTGPQIRKMFRDKAREISEPLTPAQVLACFRKWLYLEDAGLIEVILGTIAANLMDGDPVWLMIVGASGGGKTEPLNAAVRLHFVHLAATVTESSLLSGTPKKEKSKTAKGGLLREVGPFGLLLLKDFTSMLSQRRDASAAVLSAFREIYDGSWTRHVGSDGGTTLHWAGKLAVIAGCTDTIDSHHAVIGTMGERFAFYRLPPSDERQLSRHALKMAGKESQMRAELSRAVCGLFAGVELPDVLPELSEHDIERLINLAALTARCRSAVERDNHTRDITLTLSPEAPTRIAKILRQLFHGMEAIGIERPRIWAALEKIALDSMHKVRRAALEVLRDEQTHATGEIATAIQYPTPTARRALEELHAHGVLICMKGGAGKSDSWQFSDWAKFTFGTFPVFQTDDISSSSLEGDGDIACAHKYMHAEKRERLDDSIFDDEPSKDATANVYGRD